MYNTRWTNPVLLFGLMLASAPVVGQGLQTGVITGTVTSNDGLSMPGATVTVGSPALQGTRRRSPTSTATTSSAGCRPASTSSPSRWTAWRRGPSTTVVALGRTTTLDAQMAPAAVAEAGHRRRRAVAGRHEHRSSARTTTQGGDRRAARRPHAAAIAELAPGLTDNTPNTGQVHDRRRLRLRQRLPDRRRRRQRQHLRHATTTCSSRTPSRRRRC